MNSLVKRHIQEVVPGIEDPIPTKLVQFTSSLYAMSVQQRANIPKNQEIARYYVCAFLAAEKYQDSLEIPAPSVSRFPIPPKTATKLISDFRGMLSQVASPVGTPKKRGRPPSSTPAPAKATPKASPTKKAKHTPKITSPLKKLRALADEDVDVSSVPADSESPFLIRKNSDYVKEDSPSRPRAAKSRKALNLKDVIEAANHFYIPAWVTAALINSFNTHRVKFQTRSEWHLLCGLVYAAYIRINHKLLDGNSAGMARLQSQLFNYQKGHVVKANLLFWCTMVDTAVQHEPWIVDLDKKFVLRAKDVPIDPKKELKAKLGPNTGILDTIGSMINANTLLNSDSQTQYYDNWTRAVLQKIA